MAYFRGIYKCQLCGWTETKGKGHEIPAEKADSMAAAISDRGLKRKDLREAFPSVCTHKCASGEIGVAYFAGLVELPF